MKLERSFIINGNIVNKVASILEIDVYEYEDQDTSTEQDTHLYFVSGTKVVKELVIEPGCGQNMGYADITFKEIV